MTDQKISELPEITTPVSGDVVPIVSGGGTRRVTTENLKEFFNDYANIVDLGAVGDGVTDDSAAIQAAIDAVDGTGGIVFIPVGNYLCNSTLTIASGQFSIVGESQRQSQITSGVVGASLFDITGNVTFLQMRDFRLVGNGLTGASGNGHAINLIDPNIGSGANSPQSCHFERLAIIDFRGNDAEGGGSDFEACGFIFHDGIGNVVRDCNIAQCGQGIYARLTEHCRVENCIISDCDVTGIMSYAGENFVISECDVIDCGDGTGRTVPEAINDFNIISMRDQGTVIENTKLKNPSGEACIGAELCDGLVIRGNWIRPDRTNNGDHKGVYVERSTGTRIIENTFSAAVSGFTGNYQHIELFHTQTVEPFSGCTIANNTFEVQAQNTDYFIAINGNSGSRLFTNIRIVGNSFGQRASVSTNTVADAILIGSAANVQGLTIQDNSVVATTNTTVTDCLDINGSVSNEDISRNEANTNGGTITNNWDAFQGGSFTATLTGCTTSPTGAVDYSINGEIVTLEIPDITGTSNTTSATLTGMPSYIQPASTQNVIAKSVDSGNAVISQMTIGTSGTITLYNVLNASGFTASGTKGVPLLTITYKRE